MKFLAAFSNNRLLAGVLAAATLAASPMPAAAQDEVSEARIRAIEAQLRALQRNVFPDGAGQYFEPQITSGNTGQPNNTTNPATTTAVTDILARLDAIEQQLQRLTALSEENGNTMSGLETRIAALESARTAEVETTTEVASIDNTADATADAVEAGAREAAVEATTQPTGPSPARLAAVQAIAKPQTDDPGDDDYSYGFRLWQAGFYPEARQALSSFIEQYPGHFRQTYGRNLLGRAYLDDGDPDEAASWFIKNYQTDKQARRAPDSLLYLSEAMIALNDTRRACIALGEFATTYPAVANGRLADQYQANRSKVDCSQVASN